MRLHESNVVKQSEIVSGGELAQSCATGVFRILGRLGIHIDMKSYDGSLSFGVKHGVWTGPNKNYRFASKIFDV